MGIIIDGGLSYYRVTHHCITYGILLTMIPLHIQYLSDFYNFLILPSLISFQISETSEGSSDFFDRDYDRL